jgi:hypothetical protein
MSNTGRTTASNTSTVLAPIRGYYSNAVRVSAGHCSCSPDRLPSAPRDGSLKRLFGLNIERILAAHGATMADVVRIRPQNLEWYRLGHRYSSNAAMGYEVVQRRYVAAAQRKARRRDILDLLLHEHLAQRQSAVRRRLAAGETTPRPGAF